MSLSCSIRRPDRRPLGPIADIKRQLSEAFPGTEFRYQAEEPRSIAEFKKRVPWFLRLFAVSLRYPHYEADFKRSERGSIRFYFEADEPVRSIRATLYGLTSGLDDNFDRLTAATGWKVKYPPF